MYFLRCVLMWLPVILLMFMLFRWPLLQPPLSIDELPPKLAMVTRHHARPAVLPARRPEWKRPCVLTAHATRAVGESVFNVAIFTTGTDTQSYGRRFHVVACQIGERTYSVKIARPEVTICEVDTPPRDGDYISVLLRLDAELRAAIEAPAVLSQEVFELKPGDVTRVNASIENEKDVAAVASDLRWHDGLIDVVDPQRPRYELCLMNAMKQYPYLLHDFVEYYRRAGVDQVYIYDNFADTNLATYMSRYNFVQVIFWPWTRSQMQSFTHFVRAARTRCKYVAFFDADEYIMVGATSRIALKRYIKHRAQQGHKQIVAHFLRFLNNGYVHRPRGALPELYTRREKDQAISLGKAIIDADHEFYFHKIHVVEGKGTNTYWNTTLELDPTSLDHNAMLMHYTDRSWEENVLKSKYGGSSPMTTYRKPEELDVNNPDPDYMNKEKTVPFDGFVARYRGIMQLPQPSTETLVWKENDRWCRRQFCRSCWSNIFSKPECQG